MIQRLVTRSLLNLAALAALFLMSSSAAAQRAGVVNVNTATVGELQRLPGVGAVLAARIVAGRPYAIAAQLGKVKGLGGDGKRLAKMLPYIATTGATTLQGKVSAPRKAASQDSERDLSLYSPAARDSIRRGLVNGTVHFEPNPYGGEYISKPPTTVNL